MSFTPIPLRALLLEMLQGPRNCKRQQQPPCRLHSSACSQDAAPEPQSHLQSLFSVWIASRTFHGADGPAQLLAPGAQRPLSRANIQLALQILQRCSFQLFVLLWSLHPVRAMFMVSLDICRGLLPAFRGYSQALIIDELQSMISSGNFVYVRLCRLIATELLRVVAESALDSLASSNESIVQNSARYTMEYKQMEQRVRMDVPTLSDPVIRDLFQESDLFVRSFSGASGFGLLSPFDFLRILTLLSELFSHIIVLWSLTVRGTHIGILIFTLASSVLPLIMSWRGHGGTSQYEDTRDPTEIRMAAKQERMRSLSQSDLYRPEIVLFGLGPWILQTWAKARRHVLGLDKGAKVTATEDPFSALLSNAHLGGLSAVIHNVPLVLLLQSSSASLGSFTLYRSSVQSLVLTARALVETLRLAVQGVFLMGAFCAAMEVQPHLQPKKEALVRYRSSGKGVKIEARNLSYTYPGSHTPALRNVSFTLEAGERLAIVGCNGSGKSTLANIILRITGFDSGELLVNGRDIRRYSPADYHEHVTAVFQGFSRFDGSVKQNVGVGYVPDMRSPTSIDRAVALAGATKIVRALPNGMKTALDASGCNPVARPFSDAFSCGPERRQYGLSGGEWQRIALSRAFMRAHRPEVDLLVLDEPTSSLDAHAQSKIFETVEQISSTPTGERTKSVIFITHRLATARRADKIAMLENGTITEFGTHQELLRRNGSYAALYRASV